MTETNGTVDLWGDIITEPIRTPQLILKEQGALLERKTKGILTVEVSSTTLSGDIFQHVFKIKSSNMNYSYQAFYIRHPVDLYPVIFHSTPLEEKSDELLIPKAKDEKEFMELLKQILQSEKIQKVINSLISQSTGV
jgi:hypothetical protein